MRSGSSLSLRIHYLQHVHYEYLTNIEMGGIDANIR